jgi:hypothetical protein
MKEYVLIEFLFPGSEYGTWNQKLTDLDDDFVRLKADEEHETDDEGYRTNSWIRISGKISSAYASVIKLQDPYLAEHMRVSYISDELKNKYRK